MDDIESKIEGTLSLLGTVVVQRGRELKGEGQKLARQRAFLREERRRARMEEELLRQDVADHSLMKNDDWIPAEYVNPHGPRVRLNVGGQVFEASKAVLQRDPASLLAALCHDSGPLRADLDGTVHVDRDWWTFRYIIKFLRDGILPTNASLLTQLYREAGYWRCDSLKRAIEEQMHLYRSTFEVDAYGGLRRQKSDTEEWWRAPPNRWKTTKKEDAPPAKEAVSKETTKGKTDWWTGSAYNGRKYPSPKAETSPKNEDIPVVTSTTWTTTEDESQRWGTL
eukprot:g9313.t1